MKIRILTAAALLLALCLTACGVNEKSQNDTVTAETPVMEEVVETLTKEEFLQYIRANEVGVAEEDFEDIDIDDFIRSCAWTTLEDLARFRIDTALKSYRQEQENLQRNAIFAKELRSVDSTDKEYDVFVQAYLTSVGEEYTFIASSLGLDRYDIYIGERNTRNRYIVEIGRTMNLGKYEIMANNKGIYSIVRDTMTSWFCYSNDDKYFVLVSGKDPDVAHNLRVLFTAIEP